MHSQNNTTAPCLGLLVDSKECCVGQGKELITWTTTQPDAGPIDDMDWKAADWVCEAVSTNLCQSDIHLRKTQEVVIVIDVLTNEMWFEYQLVLGILCFALLSECWKWCLKIIIAANVAWPRLSQVKSIWRFWQFDLDRSVIRGGVWSWNPFTWWLVGTTPSLVQYWSLG